MLSFISGQGLEISTQSASLGGFSPAAFSFGPLLG